MINVPLTQSLRLVTDSHNFIVEERVLVDPTRAPGYKPQEGVAPPPVREDWREIAYYPQRPESLANAIGFAATRAAARSDAKSLTELAELIREKYHRMTREVNAAILPSDS